MDEYWMRFKPLLIVCATNVSQTLLGYFRTNDSLPHPTISLVNACLKIQEQDKGEGQWVRQIRAYIINDQEICLHYC